MKKNEFYQWLIHVKGLKPNTAKSRTSNCERICEYCGDIDNHYQNDKCQSLLESMAYTSYDEAIKLPPRHPIPINGNIRTGTATLKQALHLYIHFLKVTQSSVSQSDATAINAVPKEVVTVKRDSYKEFIDNFKISKEQFYKYGISTIIFAPIEKAERLWKETKQKLLTNQELHIRGYGRQGRNSNQFLDLYKFIFDNDKIKIDSTNNAAPKKIIQNATGYKINSHLFNYQSSHIWGHTKNPLLFESAWNICFVPRLYDPLTGHECTCGWNDEFSKLLRQEAYIRFKNIIDDYNKFVEDNSVIEKIIYFSKNASTEISDNFLNDAISEWTNISK